MFSELLKSWGPCSQDHPMVCVTLFQPSLACSTAYDSYFFIKQCDYLVGLKSESGSPHAGTQNTNKYATWIQNFFQSTMQLYSGQQCLSSFNIAETDKN